MNNYLALIEKYKSPLYVYNGDKIISQYNKLQKAFSSWHKVRIHYAMKALNNIAILKLLKAQGAHIDAVSIGEVKLALFAGFTPKEISFTPNGVPFSEIEEAVAIGVHITLDNLEQIERYSEKYSKKSIAIRIKPNVKAGGNDKISVGHKGSKFGIALEDVIEIVALVKADKLQVDGFHLHTGSDILHTEDFLDAAEVLFEVARQFNNLKFLDFGSGFKVKYNKTDIETDINTLGKSLTRRFSEFCKDYGSELTLVLEPGKFLVSESGKFLARVTAVKHTTEKRFIFLDSGFNHLMRPMLYDAYHDIINLSNPSENLKKYDVVGYICETDTFANDRLLSETKSGDVLAFANAGAYAFTMASNYNSRLRPAEVLCLNNTCKLIRKRETFEDLLHNQVLD